MMTVSREFEGFCVSCNGELIADTASEYKGACMANWLLWYSGDYGFDDFQSVTFIEREFAKYPEAKLVPVKVSFEVLE